MAAPGSPTSRQRRDERSMFAPAPRGRREMHAASGALQVFASPARSSFTESSAPGQSAAAAAATEASLIANGSFVVAPPAAAATRAHQPPPSTSAAQHHRPMSAADHSKKAASSSSSSDGTSSASSTATDDSSTDDDDDASSVTSSSSSSSDESPSSTDAKPKAQQGPSTPTSNSGPFRAGDLVGANRFQVVSLLGRGAFSYVYLVKRLTKAQVAAAGSEENTKTPTPPPTPDAATRGGGGGGGGGATEMLAMKVFRAGRRYDSAAMHEWDTMQALTIALGKNNGFLSTELGFRSRAVYSCILMKLAGPSLLSVLKGINSRRLLSGRGGGSSNNAAAIGLPDLYVRSIAFQVLSFLASCHEVGIVNTDLKPENVVSLTQRTIPHIVAVPKQQGASPDATSSSPLLVRVPLPLHSQVAVIDFSNAVFRFKDLTAQQANRLPAGFPRHHEEGPSVIQTRHYRAPEVLFGRRWSFAADVWSVGCMLCEMATGRCLFMTHEDAEHVALMYQILGPPSEDCAAMYAREGRHFGRLFASSGRPRWPTEETKPADIEYVRAQQPLAALLAGHADPLLVDLVRKMLDWSPTARLTAEQCLAHPYFGQQ